MEFQEIKGLIMAGKDVYIANDMYQPISREVIGKDHIIKELDDRIKEILGIISRNGNDILCSRVQHMLRYRDNTFLDRVQEDLTN